MFFATITNKSSVLGAIVLYIVLQKVMKQESILSLESGPCLYTSYKRGSVQSIHNQHQ